MPFRPDCAVLPGLKKSALNDGNVITATFIFLGELNDFLPRFQQGQEISLSFAEHQTTKHLVESLGIPHVEIGCVSVDDQPVEGSYRPHNGDRLEVRPAPPGCPVEPRFLIDNHLGRLAAYLRMLGFDCLYQNDYEDDQMAGILATDPRILLTRDRRLLMRKTIQYGYCPRSLEPMTQLREVVRHFALEPLVHPFQRCLRCNALLETVEKSAVIDQLEPKTKLYYNEFARCPDCGQVYWKGSHWKRMQELVGQTLKG